MQMTLTSVPTTTMEVWAWGLTLVHATHRGYHPRDLPNLAALHGGVNWHPQCRCEVSWAVLERHMHCGKPYPSARVWFYSQARVWHNHRRKSVYRLLDGMDWFADFPWRRSLLQHASDPCANHLSTIMWCGCWILISSVPQQPWIRKFQNMMGLGPNVGLYWIWLARSTTTFTLLACLTTPAIRNDKILDTMMIHGTELRNMIFNELAWIDMRGYPGGPLMFLLQARLQE